MKLATFSVDGEVRLGLGWKDGLVVDVAAAQRRLSSEGLVGDGPVFDGDLLSVIAEWDGPAGAALRALH
ncbi:MAG: 5-carboxymethyl-2-hydroxymuconate isomerase, partial [Alicyclobacillaceae bacterium]|nr:5-carboxymethyl-2-hydroxymuconate isomerase [Alicyclobacillaceae bacterium]